MPATAPTERRLHGDHALLCAVFDALESTDATAEAKHVARLYWNQWIYDCETGRYSR